MLRRAIRGVIPRARTSRAMLVVVVATVADHWSGRRRGRPTRPPTAGTRSSSGISCVTSWRLPPVSVNASGIPVASTRRWCFDPALPLSTGLGPVSEPPFSPARGSRRRSRVTTRSRPQRATASATARAACPTPRPAATHPACASRCTPIHTRAPAADASTRSPCAARTRSPTAPHDPAAACGPDTSPAAAYTATTARRAPTTRPERPTANSQPSAPLPA